MRPNTTPTQPVLPGDPASIARERVPCPKCGVDDSFRIATGQDHLYLVPGEFHVAECRRCGLWFQNPRPALAELSRLYPHDYGPHTLGVSATPRPTRPARAFLKRHCPATVIKAVATVRYWMNARKRAVDLVPQFVPGGRLLEIGCATGERLKQLRALGWQHLSGIELVPAAADHARAAGFAVRCGPVEGELQAYPDGFFDVIISSMVLEHLANPFQVVRALARKLKPRGEWLFSTIVRNSLDARIYGVYWSGFDFPRHLVYFRKQDVTDMLAEDFEGGQCFHQNAPIDFVRSATWRNRSPIDRPIAAWANSTAGKLLGGVLARCGLTCRVSYRCRKRFAL